MQSIEELLSDSISDLGILDTDSSDVLVESPTGTTGVSWQEPGYVGTIDYRIRQLSYSSLLTLHQCPRKFQLYKLRTTQRTEEDSKSTITFAFGHVVGEAIQLALQGASENEIIFRMFCSWHTDLYAIDERLDKSFFTAVMAMQRFRAALAAGFLSEYELVYIDGRPSCELSFCVTFPDGFRLRGFVDAVLQNKTNGKVIVLECKTTGAVAVNPASYKNSSQAIGYSIVLDHLFPAISSYEVLYLVYQTKAKEYLPIPFTKTYLQRALWLRELLLDVETIKLYEEAGVYPMHGENCVSFGRDCEYLQTCTLSTAYLTKPCTAEEEDTVDYQVNVSLLDLLNTQLAKAEG